MSVRIVGWRRAWAPSALALSLVGPFGCREPHDVIPVAPPGVTLERVPVGPQTEAEAIGEAGPSAATSKTATASVALANAPKALPTPVGVPTKTGSGLEYVTLKEGTGDTAAAGQYVVMSYTGSLTSGKVFDSSTSFRTKIGVGQVIKGWDEGVPGMKVGEARKLTIPAALGYGKQGSPPDIPPDADLIFEVELIKVE